MSEHANSRPTRRAVVATGVKLAYAAPIIAASFKVGAINASAAARISGIVCGHSTGPNGGCMGACTKAGFTGQQCGVICGTGQSTGACPVGQGGDNPCCNAGYCDPANFKQSNTQPVVYTGPTSGCSAAPPAGAAPKGPAASAAPAAPSPNGKKKGKKKGKK